MVIIFTPMERVDDVFQEKGVVFSEMNGVNEYSSHIKAMKYMFYSLGV